MGIEDYLHIAMIILSVALVAAILLQTRGGGLGSLFGGDSAPGQYKTRRGLERTLFHVTIGLSIAFFIITAVNVYLLRGS